MTASPPSTRKDRSEAIRDAILREAEQEFAVTGFRAARLEDIAARVGIRRPSLLHHFATKQALYDAVEQRIFEDMHSARISGEQGIDDALQRLLAHLDAWLDFFVARPTAARILQRLIADTALREGDPVQFAYLALQDLDETLESGIASGAFVEITTMQFTNSVAGSILFYVCNGRQVGEKLRYDPSDPLELERFRRLLHKLARAAILP